jgi:hypothetical protein
VEATDTAPVDRHLVDARICRNLSAAAALETTSWMPMPIQDLSRKGLTRRGHGYLNLPLDTRRYAAPERLMGM